MMAVRAIPNNRAWLATAGQEHRSLATPVQARGEPRVPPERPAPQRAEREALAAPAREPAASLREPAAPQRELPRSGAPLAPRAAGPTPSASEDYRALEAMEP
jgi:hypothetical protein